MGATLQKSDKKNNNIFYLQESQPDEPQLAKGNQMLNSNNNWSEIQFSNKESLCL